MQYIAADSGEPTEDGEDPRRPPIKLKAGQKLIMNYKNDDFDETN